MPPVIQILIALLLALAGAAARAAVVPAAPSSAPATAAPAAAVPADEAVVLREYYSGNGLLQRGLHDLAATAYRKFLDQYPAHAKASVARYGLAVCLQRMGRTADAARELDVLAALPDFEFAPEVAVLLGQCRLAQGQLAAAIEGLTKFLAARPEHALAPDAAALLIEALERDGQAAAAAERARDFVGRWPQHAARDRVTLLWGLALMARQDWPAAAERFAELQRRVSTGPLAEQAEWLLAQCAEQRGARDEAQRAYDAIAARADGRYGLDALLARAALALQAETPADAVPLLDRVLADQPDAAQRCTAMLLRGRAALALDRPEEAQQRLHAAEAGCDDLADQVAYWLAKAERRQCAAGAAAERLAQAIAKYPQSPLLAALRYDRSVALQQAGDEAGAAKAVEEFLARHPRHELEPDALHLLATLDYRAARYDRAREHCRALLDRYPQNRLAAAAAFLAAECLLRNGQDAEAVPAYQQFLDRYPQDRQAPAAALRLGVALYRLGRFDAANGPLSAAAAHVEEQPDLAECLLLLGDLCLQRSEWKQAEVWLNRYLAVANAPAADEALLKLGVALTRQERPPEALAAFEQLLAQYPSSTQRPRALFERGQTLLALGRTDDAAAPLEQALQADAEGRFKAHALSLLGTIALQKKDYAVAAQRFAAAVESAADDATVAAALAQQGQALLAGGQHAEAERVLARFMERFPDDLRVAEVRARLALTLARQGRTSEALAVIEQVERSSSTLDETLRAGLSYEKAWCLRKLNRSEEAVAAYRALLAQGGGQQRAYAAVELAELLATNAQCPAAAAVLEPLRQVAEEFARWPAELQARALYRLGTCAFETGDFAAAVAALEPLLADGAPPELAVSARYFGGEACFRLRRFQSAVDHLTRIIDEHKTADVYGPSLLRLGECLAALEQWPRSEEVFARYLREFPTGEQSYQAQFGVGWARENLGRHDDAITAYRALIDRYQGATAARAQFQIGECLYAKKKYEDAVTEFLKVEILYGQAEWSAAALYEAGRCLEELGKTPEARKQYEAVREKYAATRWADLAAQRLAASAKSGLPGRDG